MLCRSEAEVERGWDRDIVMILHSYPHGKVVEDGQCQDQTAATVLLMCPIAINNNIS